MKRLFDPEIDLVIGIDPAMELNGWAVRVGIDDYLSSGSLGGIENLALIDPLNDLPISDKSKIWVQIEYPTWKGYGTEAVRAAANCWLRYLQSCYPRRLLIAKCAPVSWQTSLLGWSRKLEESPATLYVAMAKVLHPGVSESEDESAAVCIAQYGLERAMLGTFDDKPKKRVQV